MDSNEDTRATAAFLIIGNEILSGRTQDKNLAYLAAELNKIGVPLVEVRVVRDDQSEIVAAVNQLRCTATYVFTSGGIGPTHDDITTASVAAAFGTVAQRHPVAVKILQDHYADSPNDLNEARLKMAEIPVGASLIDNPVSKAPGFKMENVYVMAGVPRIMQAMLAQILPDLKHGAVTSSVSVSAPIREGDVAEPLGRLQAAYPAVDLGSYPYHRNGAFGTSLVARSTDVVQLAEVEEKLKAIVHELGEVPFETRPDGVDGYDHAT